MKAWSPNHWTAREFCCLYLFISSLIQIFILMWIRRFLFYSVGSYSMDYHSLLSLFCLLYCPWFDMGTGHSGCLLGSTDTSQYAPHYSLSSSFPSDPIRCWRLILYFPCHSPRNSHFSEESWCLLLENGVRRQDLGAGWVHWCWAIWVSSRLSGQS